ncbi:peroxiredoxin-like family protein [Pelagicoccus enzymogenes]|uniref:peroxiredoxin-like family protein n=1 Tax=Pelagicoccus enzymogenes TaxID=2773457 RepID=UPI00280DD840|nr:peroxiredoxin-like family protein [Pelagicoccus enzymogenes]MDQ8196645.1 peroxiredoxin-like family protein [Pelagicoccus enzymogenes]
MPKLAPGAQLKNLQLETIDGATTHAPSPHHRFTHLQFRRFAGCPICNLHLQSFASANDRLQRSGIQEIVFFYSSAESLLKFNSQLPFPVIADPSKKRYRDFGVESSLLSVLHPQAMLQGIRGVLRQGLGFSLRNGPLGLPADFLIDRSGILLAAKYGTHAYDQWSLEELLAIAQGVDAASVQERG